MNYAKLLRNFLILFLTIVIAVVLCSLQSVQNEELTTEAILTQEPIVEDLIDERSIVLTSIPEFIATEEPIQSPTPLSQQEQIELYIQNAVSNYPNLTTELISAIIWRESRYDPNAKNYNGTCVGLMQLSTKWHSKRAQNLGVEDLYDPYGNILTGCDLLSELLNSYNLETALMVYHGGYSYAQKYQAAGTIDQYTKDILSYAKQLKEVV